MTKPEILAPAGGQEQLLAAVRCGADAVYLGGKLFNARRNAQNFGAPDLADAVSYCHARGAKVYVTVNTVVLDSELGALEEEAERIAAAGADAVIIQDMAVLRLFAGRYPSIARHASTQTAVHNLNGARQLEEMGFDSVVLARELTLPEIETICAGVHIKTEAFVHGAHCMSVSGACYLSAMLGGRSGNRGLCAQPCRLDWSNGKSGYALSLKDMSLLSHIRQMADAGVGSFKIEGRMKRPEYVAAATTACKRALAGEPFDMEGLRAVFSRSGFTSGYLIGKRDAEMFGRRTKEDVTGAESVLRSLAALYRAETPLVPVDMAFTLRADEVALTVSDGETVVSAQSDAPQPARNRALDAAFAQRNLEKTGGTPFFLRRFSAELADGYTLPVSALNALRREALDSLLALRGRPRPHPSAPYTPEPIRVYTPSHEPLALWARFASEGQITSASAFEHILLPVDCITQETIAGFRDTLIAELPALLFPSDEPALEARLTALVSSGLRAVWANNLYAVRLGRRLGLNVHGGYGLNVTNTQALLHYASLGVKSQTVSFELAMAKILALGGDVPRGVISYGHVPLMQFRNCPLRAGIGCGACKGEGVLTDRMQIAFPVECGNRRYAALLNSVPIDLAGRGLRGFDYQLLYFTREHTEGVAEIVRRFQTDEKTTLPHTGGLYYRTLL